MAKTTSSLKTRRLPVGELGIHPISETIMLKKMILLLLTTASLVSSLPLPFCAVSLPFQTSSF